MSAYIQPDIPLPPRPSEFSEKSHELFEFFPLWEDVLLLKHQKGSSSFQFSGEFKNKLKSIFEKKHIEFDCCSEYFALIQIGNNTPLQNHYTTGILKKTGWQKLKMLSSSCSGSLIFLFLFSVQCFATSKDENWLWYNVPNHMRHGHKLPREYNGPAA